MAGKPKRAAGAQRNQKPSRALVVIPQPPPEDPKDARGRVTAYKPEYADMARELCEAGAVDVELAAFFEVTERVIRYWRNVHPDFREASRVGKGIADDAIERSLYDRASGYRYIEKQAIKLRGKGGVERVEIVDVEKFMPPDGPSMQYWLNNRRGTDWKNASTKHHTGSVDVVHTTTLEQAKEKIKAKMAQLREQNEENEKLGIGTNPN